MEYSWTLIFLKAHFSLQGVMSLLYSQQIFLQGTQDQTWYDDLSDPQLDDFDDPSDGDDYEETYVKRNRKRRKAVV